MTLDIDSAPDKKEILAEYWEAKALVARSGGRALFNALLFFLSCAALFLFTDLGPFHKYWRPFGIFSLFLWIAVLLAFAYSIGLWLSYLSALRDFKKTYL